MIDITCSLHILIPRDQPWRKFHDGLENKPKKNPTPPRSVLSWQPISMEETLVIALLKDRESSLSASTSASLRACAPLSQTCLYNGTRPAQPPGEDATGDRSVLVLQQIVSDWCCFTLINKTHFQHFSVIVEEQAEHPGPDSTARHTAISRATQ